MKKQKTATTKRKQNISRAQKIRKRKSQVRRQKILLFIAVLLFCLLSISLLRRPSQSLALRPVNSACESYRNQVQETASYYGMTEYVDLILALMMQESSGIGPDVLQSSEGAYNTRYPQVPNGITDVNYSIECGIQELKYALEMAEVESPTDIKHIELALQAYNFGADSYLTFMKNRGYDSWSEHTAEAFAKRASGGIKRAQDDPFRENAGPWAYGDQRYPEHVLQYYHP